MCDGFVGKFERCIVNSNINTASRRHSNMITSFSAGNEGRFLKKVVTLLVGGESDVGVASGIAL